MINFIVFRPGKVGLHVFLKGHTPILLAKVSLYALLKHVF